MATFLELVKDLARESGTLSPAQITAVTSQTGRAEKMVGWVKKAWDNIQNSRRDWNWMRDDFESVLIEGTTRYTNTSLSVTRWGSWAEDEWGFAPLTIYDPALGVSDERPLRQIGYEDFVRRYERGTQTERRPTDYAISPAGELCIGPAPDKAYVILGFYTKGPQALAANADVPEMPTRFHDMITQEAHRLLLVHDGALAESQAPMAELMRMRFELEREQLPDIKLG